MRGLWAVVIVGGLLGCATGRADPPYAATEEPPPRGSPPPRLGHLPPPPPNSGASADESDQRFLSLQGQARKERKQRQAAAPGGHVDVARSPATTHACEGLSAEEKLECPLDDPAAIASISDMPEGVRISLRAGSAAPERLRQQLDCHKSLAVARPQVPPACPFMDARTDEEVVERGRHDVAVELRRDGDVEGLRRQVRTALAPR